LTWLANNHGDEVKHLVKYIQEYGRWDDLYCLVGTPLEGEAFDVIKTQFEKDMKAVDNNESISLLGKWLKSINTSSKESVALAKLTARYLGLNDKAYRKSLSKLRSYSNVVEVKMSANAWGEINYEAVPSKASLNYGGLNGAFYRHDEERYGAFLASGNINAAALFPYDIVRKYNCTSCYDSAKEDPALEAQWKNLPAYFGDKKFLVMADTSGSMCGLPIFISTSLAIYAAEHIEGEYHGKFITFTDVPRFYDLDDSKSLIERVKEVLKRENVGYNTNLERAFRLVLDVAKQTKCPKEDLPEAIVIISDMEIDEFGSRDSNTLFTEYMRKEFEDAGYTMPTLVYWNVNARSNTFHAESTENVCFVSGASANVFKSLFDNIGLSAIDLMKRVLLSERYSVITLKK
jgi:hypothetical protein